MGEADKLLERLDPVADDAIRVAAILWTWLDQNLMTLGRLRRKPIHLRESSIKLGPFERIGDFERGRIEASPIVGAAELLARIDTLLTLEPPLAPHHVKSIDGDDVIVMWKRAPLSSRLLDQPIHPLAAEQPSLTTLAPRLVVCPAEIRQIRLATVSTKGASWRAAHSALERGYTHNTLSIDLNCLGDAGLEPCHDGIPPGWAVGDERGTGWFDETLLDRDIEEDCLEAAKAAILAAGPNAVLVLPELVATTRIEHALAATLRELHEQGRSPALTVVGLYHRIPAAGETIEPAERAVVGDAPLAERVNEAVVLGPDGGELWRHRKLSAALEEDIAPGLELQLADSPIGWLLLLICMDSFAAHLASRLEGCGADVLLVPSLSRAVHRHRNALQLIVQRLWALAFVCNRAPLPPKKGGSRWNEPENRSFWAVAQRPLVDRHPHPGSTLLAFRLRDELAIQG